MFRIRTGQPEPLLCSQEPPASPPPAEKKDKDLVDVLLHELKQPLLCVLVLGERLQNLIDAIDDTKVEKGPILKRDIASLLNSVGQMRELLSTGSAFAQGRYIEEGWGEMVLQSLKSLESLATERSAVLTLSGDLSTQNSGPEPKIINQLLSNIVLNALEEMEASHVAIRNVHVEGKSQGETFCVRIHDSGKGVPPHLREKIFEKSFTTKAQSGGSGIGLWLCRKLAEAVNGTIHVTTSERTGGACFEIAFPCNSKTNTPLRVVA